MIKKSFFDKSIFTKIFSYFLPIAIGMLLQQSYSIFDGLILGRLVGKEALASVSGTNSTLINLVITLFAGLSSGAMVLSSQAFGRKDTKDVRKTINNAVIFSLIFGIVLFILILFLAPLLHKAMKTPSELFIKSVEYIRWYFIGVIPMLLFNMGCNILRSLGQNKKPLLFLVISSATNIILDIVFTLTFKNAIKAVAIASAISQYIAAIMIVISLFHLKDGMSLSFSSTMIDLPNLKESLRIGVPSAFQNALYFLTSLVINVAINTLGSDGVASWAIFFKYDSIYWALSSSFALAITSVSGQAYGEGSKDKVLMTARSGVLCYLLVAVPFCLLLFFLRNYAPLLFTKDSVVIISSSEVLGYLALTYPLFTFTEVFSAVMRGTGNTFKPTLITFLSICVLRLLILFFYTFPYLSNLSISLCYSLTWGFSSLLFLIYYKKGHWMKDETL